MRSLSSWRAVAASVAAFGVAVGLALAVPSTGRAVPVSPTITVGTTADPAPSSAACPSTGTAQFGGPNCSLRDAITKANEDGGGDTVVVPGSASHYTLVPANGSLLVVAPMTIKGNSPQTVVIDGGHTTGTTGVGVMRIDPGLNPNGSTNTTTSASGQQTVPVAVSISGVTIQNGFLNAPVANAAAGRAGVQATTARFTVNSAGIDVPRTNNVFSTALTLTDTAITNNSAAGAQAAGLFVAYGNSMTTLTRVTVAGNAGTAFTGGADIETDATIVNSTFSGNTGIFNGGLLLGGFASNIDYSTFADNTATQGEGGIGGIGNNDGVIGVGGDLFSGNTPSNCRGGVNSAGFNLDTDGTCGLPNTNGNKNGTPQAKLDAKLQPLADNGGAVQTRGLGDNSPALGIEATPCAIPQLGSSATSTGTTGFTADARTFPRPDLTASSGTKDTACDAGAFEKQLAAPDPGQFTKGPQPPPGGFDPEFPAGGFTLPDPLPATGPYTTQAFTDPSSTSVTVTLTIPVGALPGGTQVAFYHGQPPVLNGQIPAGKTTVDGIAVTWATPTNTKPDASKPLTVTVKDPAVPANGVLYLCVIATASACTTPAPGATVQAGQWSALFTTDPGFVLAQAAAAPTPSPTPAPAAATSPISAPIVGGGPPAEPTSPPLIAMLGALAAAGLIGGMRRRRE